MSGHARTKKKIVMFKGVMVPSDLKGTITSVNRSARKVEPNEVEPSSSAKIEPSGSTKSTATTRPHTTVIVAAVVGSIGSLLLLGIILFLLRRQKRSRLESRDSKDAQDKSVLLASTPINYSVEAFQHRAAKSRSSPQREYAVGTLSAVSAPKLAGPLSTVRLYEHHTRFIEPVMLRPEARSHEIAIEERLRHLEALAAASSNASAYQ
ncbi:hypothetical protein C8J57DRAFT_1233960 [Mycena rebaudengoi]|nr:hypothetical protein C8J57DRAFT_1233960 [Mycena rebaudengoi]